jgi:putative transposase
MDEKDRRLEAIRRVAQGELISDVCAALNRSRTWYYKWLKRFRAAGVSGLVDRRLENSPSNATREWLKKLIIKTRDRLVKQAQQGTSFQGIGAREVVRELAELQVDAPHWTTVNRILKEAGRINPTAKPIGYCPRPAVDGLNSVHQIDIWPRVLHGGERLHFFHLVDVASWYPCGMVTADKTTDTALGFLVKCWQTIGLPKIAQFDNEMTFTGGRWAHRLGRVVRLCLALGVQVWFIPFYTPERNGYVERFHGECDQFFWSRQQFQTVSKVQADYPDFLDYFRNQRQLPAIQDRTPAEMRSAWPDVTACLLPPDFRLHQRERLPITAGIIHCARLANGHGQVNILNRHITLGNDYAGHYVLARIDTAQQQMTIYQQPEAEAELEKIKNCPFPLKEAVHQFDPTFNYPDGDR